MRAVSSIRGCSVPLWTKVELLLVGISVPSGDPGATLALGPLGYSDGSGAFLTVETRGAIGETPDATDVSWRYNRG